ncbi:MAG: hypothetical protein HC890_17125 [Chloroflexaceae bacterium]|nr:hypothetical protein [Chloroflexaceae bacterium]
MNFAGYAAAGGDRQRLERTELGVHSRAWARFSEKSSTLPKARECAQGRLFY